MLRSIAGIEKVQKLYLQLLYRCNFNCQHCFHGTKLKLKDSFTFEQAKGLLSLFTSEYSATSVTFLGGEPFLHPDIVPLISFAKQFGLDVEVCTNGYRVQKQLRRAAHGIDNLRVSLEGLRETNDEIRHKGSFDAAAMTLSFAQELGVYTSVTMTVNRRNIGEVLALARYLAVRGVKEFKLHAMRVLGNVLTNKHLAITDPMAYSDLHRQIEEVKTHLPLEILFDEDLDPTCSSAKDGSTKIQRELERVEVQPSGELYVSCKAVGGDCNAFVYNKQTGAITYRPTRNDELRARIPQVRYSRA